MNTYEMEGFLRGQCVPRDLLVNESNAEYLVRKLSEIASVKAERDALAVENQALKDVFGPGEAVVNFLSIALRHTKYDCIDLPDVALAFKMSLPETPATDAALAAIQARGVEKFADDLQRTAMALCPVKPDNTTTGAYAGLARSFAKKLREAK